MVPLTAFESVPLTLSAAFCPAVMLPAFETCAAFTDRFRPASIWPAGKLCVTVDFEEKNSQPLVVVVVMVLAGWLSNAPDSAKLMSCVALSVPALVTSAA